MEHQGCLTRFLTSASLVRALNGAIKDHDDLKVGADNHPLLICLLVIIVCSLLALLFCRLTCTMKAVEYIWGLWVHMI
jgi:hypothetical protein